MGFPNELKQVLINILNNAKDALVTSNNSEKFIFIDIFKKEDKAIIEINDNAGGIDEKIIDKVFEPYFTTKHQSQGTGIGLFMCQEIVTKHMNGQISISNANFEFNNKNYTGALVKIILGNVVDE